MITLQHSDSFLYRLLRDQHIATEKPYRSFLYLIRQEIDSGMLYFNTLTKELLFLNHEESAHFEAAPLSIQTMAHRWFAVPEDHDDYRLSLQLKAVARMIAKPAHSFSRFTILTTTDCNARCFYCYELGRSRIPMTEETAEDVAKFIIDQSKGKKVELNWFGGEPLYNKAVISVICMRLRNAGIEYGSNMTTNGYLMDDITVQEAKDLWQLKGVQITLDGTEKVYNRIKSYIYKDENPFSRVINNIHRQLAAGIAVKIRINIDKHNADNLIELVTLLYQEFREEKHFSIYTHTLLPTEKLPKTSLSDERDRLFIFQKQKEIQRLLEEWNIVLYDSLPKKLQVSQCMADSDNSITILPDGHLGKCEHYTDSDWFGHIYDTTYDLQVLTSFKETTEEIEDCARCVLHPDCIRLKRCQYATICYPEMREEVIRRIRRAMLRAYEQYQTDQQAHEPQAHEPEV